MVSGGRVEIRTVEGVGCSRIFRLESDFGEFSRAFPCACWRKSNSRTRL